ncbi:MAG: helix-turn-helix transcriptional regulator [Opitutae bacterium]
MSKSETQTLKAWIKTQPLTYTQMAEQMGTDRSQISHMVNGRNPISLKRGLQFSKLMGIPLADWSPRLAAEADGLLDNIQAEVNGISGDVYYAVGVDVLDEIKNGGKNLRKIYWPGAHSANTWALAVDSEANAPQMAGGSTAVVDMDLDPATGRMICYSKNNQVGYAKYLGDGVMEHQNPNWPDRVVKIKKDTTVLGVVIGTMSDL